MQHTPLDGADYCRKSDMISFLKGRGGKPYKIYSPPQYHDSGDGGG